MKTIVDLFNILHISFNVAKTQALKEKGTFTDDDVGLYYHKVLDSVIGFSKTYGEIIFANEGRGSLEWRKNIYPEYKANRVKDEYYQIFKDHLQDVMELLSYFPCKIISVDGAEGDDVMYGLSTYFADSGEDVLVITGDGDIGQLLNYSDKISVYSPTMRKFREKDPNLVLRKAIVGDSSDNIPGIPRIGEKTFEKAISNSEIWMSKIEPNKEIVNKFLQIVDLSKAPKELKEQAILQYNEKKFNALDPQSIEMFMLNESLNEHLSRWSNDLSEINLRLYENNIDIGNGEKSIEEASIDDIENMLDFINNL